MHITASTPHLARPGIEKIVTTYNTDPSQDFQDVVGEEIRTTLSFIRLYTEGDFGYASTINEGTPITYDDWATPYTMDVTPKIRVIGWEATRQGQESDQYGLYAKAAGKLRLSLAKTMNRNVADMLNNAETASAPYMPPDGVAFFSTAHKLDTGNTGSNKPSTDIAFGAAALEQAIQELTAQVGHRGDPLGYDGTWNLIIPTGLMGVANRVVMASGAAQTTNLNEPNWAGKYIDKISVNRWFTGVSSNSWVLWPSRKEDRPLVVVRRNSPSLKTDYDINIDSDKWRLDEMYALAFKDWRRAWGTSP